MNKIYHFIYLMLVILFSTFFGCQQSATNQAENKSDVIEQSHQTQTQTQTQNKKRSSQDKIPNKVFKVLEYIELNGEAPDGYVGGRKFGNYERNLPIKDENQKKVLYQEWDVNPKKKGKNRGAERLVTGSDGSAYFTKNHYKSFIKIK